MKQFLTAVKEGKIVLEGFSVYSKGIKFYVDPVFFEAAIEALESEKENVATYFQAITDVAVEPQFIEFLKSPENHVILIYIKKGSIDPNANFSILRNLTALLFVPDKETE